MFCHNIYFQWEVMELSQPFLSVLLQEPSLHNQSLFHWLSNYCNLQGSVHLDKLGTLILVFWDIEIVCLSYILIYMVYSCCATMLPESSMSSPRMKLGCCAWWSIGQQCILCPIDETLMLCVRLKNPISKINNKYLRNFNFFNPKSGLQLALDKGVRSPSFVC